MKVPLAFARGNRRRVSSSSGLVPHQATVFALSILTDMGEMWSWACEPSQGCVSNSRRRTSICRRALSLTHGPLRQSGSDTGLSFRRSWPCHDGVSRRGRAPMYSVMRGLVNPDSQIHSLRFQPAELYPPQRLDWGRLADCRVISAERGQRERTLKSMEAAQGMQR